MFSQNARSSIPDVFSGTVASTSTHRSFAEYPAGLDETTEERDR